MTPPARKNSISRPDVNPYLDSGRLFALQIMLSARMPELFDALSIRLQKSGKLYHGACPIHGGDNPSALNVYPNGESVPVYWQCRTRRCHDDFKRTILGFVRGALSHQKYDWQHLPEKADRQAQKIVSWKETVDWVCHLVGQDIRSVEVNYEELEKRRFASDVGIVTRKPEQGKQGLSRGDVRKYLVVPAPYFVERGWSPEVLDRYDVGTYPAEGRPLTGRAAVPVYDADHRVVVGFAGRSTSPQCPRCQRWHSPHLACPAHQDRNAWGQTAKWYNHQFNSEAYLYNWWFAKNLIRDSGVAILVEGPGDVWRLVEAGVHNGLALFGVNLSDQQQILLEMSGAVDVIIMLDQDQAGQGATDGLKKRLGRSFRLHFPTLSQKDFGELTTGQIRQEFTPLVEKISRRGR